MSFAQDSFAWFLLAVFPLWWLTGRNPSLRVAAMAIASFVFYGHNQWWIMGLLGAYCVVDWAVGLRIEISAKPARALAFGIAFNLLLLGYWKYTPLLLRTAASVFGAELPANWDHAIDDWTIPMGISFYAFTGIAYMVDVYRGQLRPERRLDVFMLFQGFFPQLVAGPILRGREFLPRLQPASLPRRPDAPLEASILIARGFFKKMVLADRIAAAVDPFFAHVGGPATEGVWSLPYVYLYALQIYFDFSGYTDIARGLGLWFGFRWPENFARPYLAASMQEFWRRWHMTLSRFLRDYLYVPMGGNRYGAAREHASLMVTMLLGGLWHGAAWSFLLWGFIHAVFLTANRLWARSMIGRYFASSCGWLCKAWNAFSVALVFHAVCLGWCFFRITDISSAAACLRKWFVFEVDKMLVGGAADPSLLVLLAAYGVLCLAAAVATRGAPLPSVARDLSKPGFVCGAAWGSSVALLVLAIMLAPAARAAPFIYFRF